MSEKKEGIDKIMRKSCKNGIIGLSGHFWERSTTMGIPAKLFLTNPPRFSSDQRTRAGALYSGRKDQP